jgi:predicted peptidase
MGGFGAWQLASWMPDRLAGVASVGGAQVPRAPESLARAPIWAFHGDQDDVVNVDVSQDAVDAVQNAGGKPKLTILGGAGHGIERRVLVDEELFRWLKQQSASPAAIE